MTDGRQQDVAAGLIGLGFERDPRAVIALGDVGGHGVDRFGQTVERLGDGLGRVGLGPFTTAPQYEDAGAQLRAEVNGVERLGECETANVGIIRGQRALFEDRPREEIDRGHRNLQTGAVQCGSKSL